MTLQKELAYEATPIRKPSRDGIRVISEMGSWRIIAYLLGRHKYGLSLTINMTLVSYFAWSKVLHIFF